MRTIKFRAKSMSKKDTMWHYGLVKSIARSDGTGFLAEANKNCIHINAETIGECTGLSDVNGIKVYEGDIVKFNGQIGTVVLEVGTFGIAINDGVAYDKIQEFMNDEECCCGNELNCCFNDNFISLWEIYWNLNCEEDYLYVVEVIGNIHDDPELLGE